MNHNSGPNRCLQSLFQADGTYKITVVSSLFEKKTSKILQRPRGKKITFLECTKKKIN